MLRACAEPAGNGEGQSICSALVGSGGSVALYGRRPLRSRHRIGEPTVLHAARVHGSAAGATGAPRTGRSGPPWHSCADGPTVGGGPPTGPVGGSLFEEDHAMPRTVAQKLIAAHLVEGELEPGAEIGLQVDQTLTQDATGTMVMLELEAMGLDRIRTELSVQYVDHNLLQTDEKNPDDHLFLKSAAERF